MWPGALPLQKKNSVSVCIEFATAKAGGGWIWNKANKANKEIIECRHPWHSISSQVHPKWSSLHHRWRRRCLGLQRKHFLVGLLWPWKKNLATSAAVVCLTPLQNMSKEILLNTILAVGLSFLSVRICFGYFDLRGTELAMESWKAAFEMRQRDTWRPRWTWRLSVTRGAVKSPRKVNPKGQKQLVLCIMWGSVYTWDGIKQNQRPYSYVRIKEPIATTICTIDCCASKTNWILNWEEHEGQ